MDNLRISRNFFPKQDGNGLPLGNGKVAIPGFMVNLKVNLVHICGGISYAA